MSRDEQRINDILDDLEQYWHEHPDLRLGQILSNASQSRGHGSDPFYMEDAELRRYLLGEMDDR